MLQSTLRGKIKMSEYILIHSRTKGSKNGVRRYQFTDGTWTEEGKARRRAEYGGSDTDSMHYARSVRGPRRKSANSNRRSSEEIEDMIDRATRAGKDGKASRIEKAARSSQDIIDASSRIVNRVTKGKPERPASEMSDKELRQKIDRMRLEQQYNDLSADQISEGAAKAREIMEYAKDIAVIGVGAASLWAMFNQIKGKQKE